jgi:hypothetical protein
LVFQKKFCFQQSSVIRLLICSGMWMANLVFAWKNRKNTVFNNVPLLGN